MRHVSVAVALGALASLAACSSLDLYATTAAALSESQSVWGLTDKDENYVLTAEEHARSAIDLESCVAQMSEWLALDRERARALRRRFYAPTREERVLNLLRCMGQKGWRLVLSNVVVTSDA